MVRWLLGVIVWGVVALSMLGFAGRAYWVLDLCNHFRFQYALVLGITTLSLVLLRSWKLGVVSLGGLALNLCLVAPLYVGASGEADAGSPELVVLQYNVNTANKDHAGVVAEILSSRADLVVVQEVDRAWLASLEAGLTGYEAVSSEARSDNFGIACFVRVGNGGVPDARDEPAFKVHLSRVFELTDGPLSVPAVEVAGSFGGRPITVLGLHALPPISGEYAAARNAALVAAGDWAAAVGEPCIVVGDLNATPWSTAFQYLVREGGLENSQAGYGRSATWPASVTGLGMIPIDHVLHSEELVTVDRGVGSANGSDHRPVWAVLRWRAGD